MSTLIIGDVHGCRVELEDLLAKADYRAGMGLVLIGDLINKGPDTEGVLRLARDLDAKVLIGNHERGFLAYMRGERRGNADLKECKRQLGARLAEWVAWIESWPLFLETDAWLAVHAGLAPGRHPRDTDPRVLTNIRTWDGAGRQLDNPEDPPWFELYHGKKTVVFGHWARRGLVVRDNAIGLDTGCVYGGVLSGVWLPERRLVQTPARRVYKEPVV